MFGIGLSEFAVILCIVIVFVRPKDLPALFRRLGKLYAQAKRAYKEITEVKDQFVKSIEVAAAEAETEKGVASPAGETEASRKAAEIGGAGNAAPATQELVGDELGEAGYADGAAPTEGAAPLDGPSATAEAASTETADSSREAGVPLK